MYINNVGIKVINKIFVFRFINVGNLKCESMFFFFNENSCSIEFIWFIVEFMIKC